METNSKKDYLRQLLLTIILFSIFNLLNPLQSFSQCNYAGHYGAGATDNYGCDITLDPGNNSYSVGKIWNGSAYNMRIQKRDENGNIIWTKTENVNFEGFPTDVPRAHHISIAYYNGFIFIAGISSQPVNLSGNIYNSADGLIYVAKYDASNGNFIGPAFQVLTGIADLTNLRMCMDNVGNFYLTGAYVGTITIGTSTFTSLGTPIQFSDIFILKLSSAGNILWQHTGGGIGNDEVNDIAFENYNGVDILCICGHYKGSFTYPPAQTLFSAGVTGNPVEGFVIEINTTTGMMRYISSLPGYGYINAVTTNSHGVDVNAITIKNGEILMVGNANDPIIYVANTAILLTNSFPQKIYSASIDYNLSGPVIGQELGTNGNFYPMAITTNSSNSFVTGYYNDNGNTKFGGGNIASPIINLPSYGSNDIFVLKTTSVTMDLINAFHYGGTGDDQANAIAADGCKFYYTGSFIGQSNFNPLTINSNSPFYSDQFIAANGVYGTGAVSIVSSQTTNQLCYGNTITLTAYPSGLIYRWSVSVRPSTYCVSIFHDFTL